MTDDERPAGSGARRFRVASANIVNETFEDETVVVNLEAGSYYSLTRLASALWVALADRGLDDVAAELTARYDVDPAVIRESLDGFVAALQAEGLVVPDDDRASDGAVAPPLGALPEVFEPPAFERFDDMQDLLLLDPIHDVDESGWPVRR